MRAHVRNSLNNWWRHPLLRGWPDVTLGRSHPELSQQLVAPPTVERIPDVTPARSRPELSQQWAKHTTIHEHPSIFISFSKNRHSNKSTFYADLYGTLKICFLNSVFPFWGCRWKRRYPTNHELTTLAEFKRGSTNQQRSSWEAKGGLLPEHSIQYKST